MDPFFRPVFVLLFFLFSVAASESILQMLPRNARSSHLEFFAHHNVRKDDALYCDSWRFSVEVNDAGLWTEIPERCVKFVGDYLTGGRYASDSDVVADDSFSFANGVEIAGDGKDVWIFDIDETLLSNVPYYAAHGYGSELYNDTAFGEWANLAIAPPLLASLKLYNGLKGLGFQSILLTGRTEAQRIATEKNLMLAGYNSWERLILRGPNDYGKTALVYKSEKRKELEAEGYRIHGNSGDQWSDLLGLPMAARSFKLPNPMYYIE